MYNHYGEAKALFSYVNVQINTSVEGQTAQNFSFRGIVPRAPPPAGTCLHRSLYFSSHLRANTRIFT